MIQDKIFFDEKDPTGLSYNTPFTFYGSYEGRLWSKAPGGEIKFYTQNSDLSVYATTGSNGFNGNQTITGSLTVTEGITGTATTASYVEYNDVANKPELISGSAQITDFGIFATTGSNGFNGSQSITGSLTVTGQVVAQTLNVQQVTSSVVFSSGSNIFGNELSNTQQFTGSVSITGSLNTSTGANTSIIISNDSVDTGYNIVSLNGTRTKGSYAGIAGGGTGDNRLYLNSGVDVVIQTSSSYTERMRITSGGNVLIGSTSGTTLNGLTNNLSVSSTTYNLFDISRFSDNAFGANFYLVKSRNGSIGGNTIVANGDSLGNIIWVGANGTGFTDAASIKAEVDGTPGASNDMPGRLVFSTTADGAGSSTERMRITSNGFLKASNTGDYVNLTGTYHELINSVTGSAIVYLYNTSANPYGPYLRFSATAPNNGTNYFMYCDDNAVSPRFVVYSNGGIANYQANDTNLSDERTKKDIEPLESYWDKFKAIEIVKFKYKDQTHDDFNIGVIAQQVEEVAPEFVDVDGWSNNAEGHEIISEEEPLKAIYTADLYHATIKVLQEAMAKIETLEAKIQTLEQQ